MMNKILDKILKLFKGDKKAETPVAPRPKVKRQNAVPTLKNIETRSHKEMPKKHSVDKKIAEGKKKTEEVKTVGNKNSEAAKPKKKKYYGYKKFKGKKTSPK
jgi:hypothetical protein